MFQAHMARRTCFREQYYTGIRRYYWAGKIAGPDPRKLYVKILWFFIDFWGSINSFGIASFVVSDMGILLLWIAAGPSRKSICERLRCLKVTGMHGNVMEFMIRGRLTSILGPFRAQGSALTRNVSSSHGSKNLLQRAILHRHERILLGRGDCRPGPKTTICKNLMVFH